MKRLVMTLVALVHISFLSACTTNSSFDCPNKAGITCSSLDQINNMVDSGQIRGRTQMREAELIKSNPADRAEFQPFPPMSTFLTNQPIRDSETVQRIWIAPYEDTEGNYHQESMMYVIMKGGHWIAKPAKTINSF